MKPSPLFQAFDLKEKISRKETVKELVRRHLTDPNHVVTDDEIRNAHITSSAEEKLTEPGQDANEPDNP